MKLISALLTACLSSALAAGCTNSFQTQIPTGESMKGTWTGTSSGHEEGKNTGTNATLLINKAAGQTFSGTISYKYADGRAGKETIHGSIGKNGTIVIADNDGFYINGSLDNKKLYLQYIEASAEESEASNVFFEKK